ncbi:MAG: hypothetical protein RL219_2467 [Actinomycetota bacterium]
MRTIDAAPWAPRLHAYRARRVLASALLVATTGVAAPALAHVAVAGATTGGISLVWEQALGSDGVDAATGVDIGPNGDVYVVGLVDRPPSTESNPRPTGEVVLRKYSASGDEVWSQRFGQSRVDFVGPKVTVGADGSVYVTGGTAGDLASTNAGDDGTLDVFVRKFDPAGETIWTRQFGTPDDDTGVGVAVDDTGDVLVASYTFGASGTGLPSSVSSTLRRFSAGGEERWKRDFGAESWDNALDLALGADGSAYLTGFSWTLQSTTGMFLRRFTPDGDEAWTQRFGTIAGGVANTLAVAPDGTVYVAGGTYGNLTGTNAGPDGTTDAFVRAFSSDGVTAWTRQFGTEYHDDAFGVAAGTNGVVVVGKTSGDLAADGSGDDDAFVRRYTPVGDVLGTEQFGNSDPDIAMAAALAGDAIFVVGQSGYVPGNAVENIGGEAFVRAYGEGAVTPTSSSTSSSAPGSTPSSTAAPAPSTSPAASEPTGDSSGATVWIVIAAVGALALCVTTWTMFRRRKHRTAES